MHQNVHYPFEQSCSANYMQSKHYVLQELFEVSESVNRWGPLNKN